MVKKPLKRRFGLDWNVFNVTFVGLSLALMIVIIGPAQPMVSPGVSVDRPKVGNPKPMPKALREDSVTVSVYKDGSIFLGSNKVVPERLPALIREEVSKGAEKKVYIKADARAKVGSVNEVLDGIRASGVENIAFLVEQRKPVTPLPAAVGVAN